MHGEFSLEIVIIYSCTFLNKYIYKYHLPIKCIPRYDDIYLISIMRSNVGCLHVKTEPAHCHL